MRWYLVFALVTWSVDDRCSVRYAAPDCPQGPGTPTSYSTPTIIGAYISGRESCERDAADLRKEAPKAAWYSCVPATIAQTTNVPMMLGPR